MKVRSVLALCSVPLFMHAQQGNKPDTTEQGIRFEQGLHWKQVLAKAKKENKYIFVDCYTTWCIPCKKMEQEVYGEKTVGDQMNDKFISIKMQMDSLKSDNSSMRSLYPDANYLNNAYKIRGYPTFLFFNPDGKILNNTVGGRGSQDFMNLVATVLDPKNDYYGILKEYRSGKRDLSDMQYLTRTTLALLGDTALSRQIAQEYFRSLNKDNWFSKRNIQFMRSYIQSSKDTGFNILYRYADTINKVMKQNDYAQELVQTIFYREIVIPFLRDATNTRSKPNWDLFYSKIAGKYNDYYAERLLIESKADWAGKQKNWSDYTKYFVFFIEKYKYSTNYFTREYQEDFSWNAWAWQIFSHSNDREELLCALKWSTRSLTLNPSGDWMDTYSNILYKLGYTDLALSWEGLAVKQYPPDNPNKEIQINFEKMKMGQPTWPAE